MQRRSKPERDSETGAHTGKARANNPPVGLIAPETGRDTVRAAVKIVDDRGVERLEIVELG